MEDRYKRQGMFSWQELMTDDAEQSRKFYGELLGWTYKEFPMEEGESYWVVKIGEEEVAGMMKTPPAAKGAPSFWGVYITVDNVDATANKAEKLGAKIIVPPTDIPKVGRFATIQDSGGAIFNIIKYAEM